MRALIVVVFMVAACGDDAPGVGLSGDVVGGPCATSNQCAGGSECQTGGDFPGGTCTVPCLTQSQCPSGTVCIDKGGGMCLLPCQTVQDCRGGYKCKLHKRKDKSDEALVCLEKL
jgi:hypothetical protein